MERDRARVNVVAGTVAIVAAGIFLSATAYWWSTKAEPIRCLFGDPQCSQTIATYLLCILTAGAFFAAVHAVVYTRNTVSLTRETLHETRKATQLAQDSHTYSIKGFELERTPVMTVQRCVHLDDGLFTSRPGRMPRIDVNDGHADIDILQYFIDDTDPPILSSVPPLNCVSPAAETAAPFPYELHHFDVLSLGKVPFINGWLELSVDSHKLRMYAGSVAPNDYVHIVLWVSNTLHDRSKVAWSDTASAESFPVELRYVPPLEKAIGKTFDYDIANIAPEPPE